MSQKCCCGCFTLSSGTKIALTICAIQAILELLWYSELLMLLNDSKSFNPLKILINLKYIEDIDVFHGLVLAGIGLNAFWFFSAIVAARGNITLSNGQLALWDIQTYLIILFDLGTTIYFAIKIQGTLMESQQLYLEETLDGIHQKSPSQFLTYLSLLVVASKGIIFLPLNIYFAHIVQMRGREIDHDHSVLAFYVLSHIARCRGLNEVSRSEARSGSESSNWSLSYDAIKGSRTSVPEIPLL